MVFTILHAGGTFGGGGYKVSGGLHGVGAAVVNALSEWVVVQIYTDGKIHEQRYERGKTVSPLKVVGETKKQGSYVHFKPDPEIFEELEYQYDILRQRLQEMAFLTKGLTIVLKDERPELEQEKTFHYEGGIQEFVAHLNKNKDVLYEPIIYAEGERWVYVEVAIQHNTSFTENVFCLLIISIQPKDVL